MIVAWVAAVLLLQVLFMWGLEFVLTVPIHLVVLVWISRLLLMLLLFVLVVAWVWVLVLVLVMS